MSNKLKTLKIKKEEQEKLINSIVNEIKILQQLQKDYKEKGLLEELYIAQVTEDRLLYEVNRQVDILKNLKAHISLLFE